MFERAAGWRTRTACSHALSRYTRRLRRSLHTQIILPASCVRMHRYPEPCKACLCVYLVHAILHRTILIHGTSTSRPRYIWRDMRRFIVQHKDLLVLVSRSTVQLSCVEPVLSQ